MHVIVLGAGVVGVTSAYYLAQAGHQVSVIDRANHVAAGASYANGGQLSYSFTDAMANPAFLSKLPKFVLGLDPAVKIDNIFNPALMRWGSQFLGQCTSQRAHRNSITALKLALRSSQLLTTLLEHAPLDFSFRRAGKLVLIRNKKSLTKAARNCEVKRQHGCNTEVLNLEQATMLEPQLISMPGPYVGAVYSENDEVADARAFTEGLANWLMQHQNVDFHMSQNAHGLHVENDSVRGVLTDSGVFEANAVVMCTGAWTDALLKPLGISAGIYPVRGYSVSLPPHTGAPSISLTDYERKIVFSRLNDQIRIAGFADFVGFNTNDDSSRVSTLLDIAQRVAPKAAQYGQTVNKSWGGLRPMTPDGLPRVGSTTAKNLFLNTGHGMFGWTLACASGYDLAAAVNNYYHNNGERESLLTQSKPVKRTA